MCCQVYCTDCTGWRHGIRSECCVNRRKGHVVERGSQMRQRSKRAPGRRASLLGTLWLGRRAAAVDEQSADLGALGEAVGAGAVALFKHHNLLPAQGGRQRGRTSGSRQGTARGLRRQIEAPHLPCHRSHAASTQSAAPT